jgi:KaiC/GvpD/RAD55 family RecA-like ATPase
MLRGETTPDTLVVTEGEPDYLSWASSSPEQAVIGIVNIKGWDQSIADRIPTGTTIYVRTDPDTAGHKYADAIVDSLADRGVVVWRRDPQDSSGIDDNDALMRNGSLPSLSQGLICVQGGAADPEPQDDIIPRWHDQVLQYGIAFGQPPTAKIPVPWAQLAITLGGGWEIGVQALIGPTGAGKSQVATHIALHAATHGHPTLLCSLELSRSMAIAKLLAAKTGIAWSKQLARDLTDDQYGRLAIALQHLYDLPLDLISNTDRVRSVEDIEAYARKFVACYEQRPLIVVDYLSYLTAFEGKEIRQATQAITSSLDALASELSATVLLVAATSRQYYDALRWDPSVDHKPGEVPVWRKHAGSFVALAKESGGVEYSAHAIIALAVEVGVEHDTLHLGIAKNRSGRCSIGGCWTRLSLENGICEEL